MSYLSRYLSRQIPIFSPSVLLWLFIAIGTGAVLALLPLNIAVSVLIVSVMLVLSLIDTRIAVIITLVVSPLKILLETEVAFFRDLPIDIGQIAFLLMVCIWMAKAIANHRKLWVFTPVIIPVFLILSGAILSLWNSVAIFSSLKEIVQWIEVAVMIVIVISLVYEHDIDRGKPNIQWLVNGLIAAACAQAVIGIYEFRGGSGATHLWILDFRYFRAFGSFGQPNPFGAFMGLSLCLSLGAAYGCLTQLISTQSVSKILYQIRHKKMLPPIEQNSWMYLLLQTILYGASSILLAGGLLVSWSRGAWMGFGAGLVVIVFFAPKRRLVGAGLVTAAILIFVGSVVTGLAPQSLVNRLSDFTQDLTGSDDVRGVQINDDNYAVIERLAHWQAAVGMATDNPLIGVGFGAYEAAYPRYALMNWPMALGHSHNYYLNLLAETGVIGLCAYLAAWIMIFAFTLRILATSNGFMRGVALGLLGTWTNLAVHSFFDKLYVNNLLLHFGAMLGLIGLLLVGARINTTSETPQNAYQTPVSNWMDS